MEVWPEITEALENAITAGACRRAAFFSPITAETWQGLAETYSERASARLSAFCDRLDFC